MTVVGFIVDDTSLGALRVIVTDAMMMKRKLAGTITRCMLYVTVEVFETQTWNQVIKSNFKQQEVVVTYMSCVEAFATRIKIE